MDSVEDYIKLSVIVLTYNHEKYIKKALESILNQEVTFKYEILIGDDCSTDGTLAILEEYENKYNNIIRVYKTEKNMGATKNSYRLLTRARGEYLATLEGDDYWTYNKKLQTQVDFLEHNREYIGCTHRFSVIDEHGNLRKNKLLNWILYKEGRFSIEDFGGLMMPSQPSTFVRRNIFRNPAFDYTHIYKIHPMIGDRTLMLIYLLQGDFFCMENTMSCYRCVEKKNAKNITSQQYKGNEKKIEDEISFNEKLEEYALHVFKRQIKFDLRRKNLFFECIVDFVKNPKKEKLNIIKKLYLESDNKLNYIVAVPRILIKKIKYRLFKNN